MYLDIIMTFSSLNLLKPQYNTAYRHNLTQGKLGSPSEVGKTFGAFCTCITQDGEVSTVCFSSRRGQPLKNSIVHKCSSMLE